MQYLGPILMGIGSFILIIACVVTLESRDKHAQIITEESILQKKRRLVSAEKDVEQNDVFIVEDEDEDDKVPFFGNGRRFVALDANRLAPLADVDSLTDISLTHRAGSHSRLPSEDVPQEEEEEKEEERGEVIAPEVLQNIPKIEKEDVEIANGTISSPPKKLRLEHLASQLE
uniref:Uncharacterized protein n=1 Tax=Caenorhabditis japonica TaxID=281687 RepID=A0A8R1HN81_CAEJA